jgi:TniQ
MKGLTSPLWPIHFKPLPDELLSSWLVRLAHSHGLKVQTFCNLLFGNTRQLWNRDIDRLAPDWLLQALSDRTGTPIEEIFQSTLRSYEGWLYPKIRTSGTLQWITALKLHHRKFEGHGIQFCPQCLTEDNEPYFRKRWRVAFNTICVKHNCMLHDRCQNCGTGIAFHRVDVGHKEYSGGPSLTACHCCGFDLKSSKTQQVHAYTLEIKKWLLKLSISAFEGDKKSARMYVDSIDIMRKFAMLLTSKYETIGLYSFICKQLDIAVDQLSAERESFEARPLNERHRLIQLVGWLMIDPESRIEIIWRAKAVRYNHLLKDLQHPPKWYLKITSNLICKDSLQRHLD